MAVEGFGSCGFGSVPGVEFGSRVIFFSFGSEGHKRIIEGNRKL